jgi:hypothetical protein
LNILAHIGRATLALLEEIGRVALFLKDALIQGLTPKIFLRQILEQMLRIGYFSLPVVGLTAFFTGGRWRCRSISAPRASTRKAWLPPSWRWASPANWARCWRG